jgi:hypothetical protein
MVVALAAMASVFVLLFGGAVAGVAGIDHDRRRTSAVVGAVVNSALLILLIYLLRR